MDPEGETLPIQQPAPCRRLDWKAARQLGPRRLGATRQFGDKAVRGWRSRSGYRVRLTGLESVFPARPARPAYVGACFGAETIDAAAKTALSLFHRR